MFVSESLVQKGKQEPNSNTELFEDATEEILKVIFQQQ